MVSAAASDRVPVRRLSVLCVGVSLHRRAVYGSTAVCVGPRTTVVSGSGPAVSERVAHRRTSLLM